MISIIRGWFERGEVEKKRGRTNLDGYIGRELISFLQKNKGRNDVFFIPVNHFEIVLNTYNKLCAG
ncbi:MAG: hypothetical protein ACI8P3_003842 [Saprospiraceae bacterium]|jgi:hypothetical protein